MLDNSQKLGHNEIRHRSKEWFEEVPTIPEARRLKPRHANAGRITPGKISR